MTTLNLEITRVRELLSSRSRHVEPGCVIKVPIEKLFGSKFPNKEITYIYGLVGQQVAYCDISTTRSYDVKFYTENMSIPYELRPLLHYPIVDSDMVIIRFPEQNVSIDDPNIDRYFYKTDGKWQIRSA